MNKGVVSSSRGEESSSSSSKSSWGSKPNKSWNYTIEPEYQHIQTSRLKIILISIVILPNRSWMSAKLDGKDKNWNVWQTEQSDCATGASAIATASKTNRSKTAGKLSESNSFCVQMAAAASAKSDGVAVAIRVRPINERERKSQKSVSLRPHQWFTVPSQRFMFCFFIPVCDSQQAWKVDTTSNIVQLNCDGQPVPNSAFAFGAKFCLIHLQSVCWPLMTAFENFSCNQTMFSMTLLVPKKCTTHQRNK